MLKYAAAPFANDAAINHEISREADGRRDYYFDFYIDMR